jgi:hypothetical protein
MKKDLPHRSVIYLTFQTFCVAILEPKMCLSFFHHFRPRLREGMLFLGIHREGFEPIWK